MNIYYTHEDIQMGNKNMKRCLISLVVWATLMKITMRYNYIPVRMIKIGEDVEELGLSYIDNMNAK